MKSRRTYWLLFGAGAALVVTALVWVTFLVLRLESEARHEASVRLALWRMDSWLGPRIGREELRPYFEYLPFYAQQRAYTRLLNEIEPGEVITPSSLLTFESDLFPLHFQVNTDGSIVSPQVPTGNWGDLAEGSYLPEGAIARHRPMMDRVQQLLSPPVQIETCVSNAEDLLARVMGEDRVHTETRHSLAFDNNALQPMMMQQTAEQGPDIAYIQGQTAGNVIQAPMPPSPQTNIPPPQSVQDWAAGVQQRKEVQSAISKSDMARRSQKGGYAQQELASNFTHMEQQQQAQVLLEPQKGAEIINVESVTVGELVPVWLTSEDARTAFEESVTPASDRSMEDENRARSAGETAQPAPADPTLVFLRRVRIGDSTIYQGILCDWPTLSAALREQISDLFPNAVLRPAPVATPALMESGRMLGSVPVTLEAPCPSIAGGPLMTPARTTLGLTWLAMLGAIVAAGITLRSSILYGEKRSRFASAVTHELRTPLTTFRMYSEMLAEGMVQNEDQRATYLRTLQQESGRLSTLVENVLTYARLEEGRPPRHVQTMSVADLLSRVRDVLQRRADDAGMQLLVRDPVSRGGMALVSVDPDAIEQILFNLVDNACKYAGQSTDKRIELDVRKDDSRLTIAVRDYGPGISTAHERAIFRAFDRGAHGPGDTIPGVGLGLALARGLARDMGGELSLQPASRGECGACFNLTLPAKT